MVDIFPAILPDADDRQAFDANDTEPGIEELLAEGICPWCDDTREFENVAAHASQAHAQAWQKYSGD